MKKIFLFFLLIASSFANSQDTIYFNEQWKETTKEKSTYYRPLPLKKIGELVLLKDYYKNGQLQFQSYIYPNNEDKYVGDAYWYDENGFDSSFRQNINLSKQKELIYYNNDGSIWKKNFYNNSGTKSKIIIYHKGKEFIKGEIDGFNFIGTFLISKPESYYNNPFNENDFSNENAITVNPVISNDENISEPNYVYNEVIYWHNGTLAKETLIKNYTEQPSDYWDVSGKKISQKTKDENIKIEYFTKNGFAIHPKKITKTINHNNNYLSTTTTYNMNGEIKKINQDLNGDFTEETIFENGKKIILKYHDGNPFDGNFNEKNGRYHSIFKMENGKYVGEVIVNDNKTLKLIAKGDYINGKPNNGTFVNFENNRVIISSYKKQKQEGLQQIFSNASKENPIEEFEMKDNLMNGFRKIYSSEETIYESNYINGKPFDGVILEGKMKETYKNGELIQKDELNDYPIKVNISETYENNKLKTKTYSNFVITDEPQQSYTGIYKNEEPYDGYFINKVIFNEIPIVDYYEKGELKNQFSFDLIHRLDHHNFYEFNEKTTFKNGEIIDGFEFIENDKGVFTKMGYKNGKANFIELNIFAMHYFNRLTFELLKNEIIIKDFEKQTTIKFINKNETFSAEILNKDEETIINNEHKKIEENSPKTIIIYKIENKKLAKEIISLDYFETINKLIPHEVSPLMMTIFSSVAYNRETKPDVLFNLLVKMIKNSSIENIEESLANEIYNSEINQVISNVIYNENGKPDNGIKITEKNNEYLLELYTSGQITETKTVKSLNEIKQAVFDIFNKNE